MAKEKPDTTNNRLHPLVNFRAGSRDEKDAITAAAVAAGTTTSAYVREAVAARMAKEQPKKKR